MIFWPWVHAVAARRGFVGGILAAAAIALGLVACGGGGGDSTAAAAAPSGSSATASAFTQGTLTGFGSIIVNGLRFDEAAATVVDDSGATHAASALALGMQVEVDSDRVVGGAAKAHAVRFGSVVLGPVASVDDAAQTFVVLGQTVDVGTDTVFGSDLSDGLAALAAGTVVAVHGLPDSATGHIVATRIESASGAAAYKLRGKVAALDTGAKTFAIGAAVIDYSGIAAADVPASLADGVVVRVVLATAPNTLGQWVATRLGAGGAGRPADRADAFLRGTITAFASTTSFSVNGIDVDASAASFPDGTSGLALGVAVEVAGTVSNGVLAATVVRLESAHAHDDSHRPALHGQIATIDTTKQTFVVRGVTVSYAGTVAYVNGTEADLAVGRAVSVVGTIGASSGGTISGGAPGSKPGARRNFSVVQATTITFD